MVKAKVSFLPVCKIWKKLVALLGRVRLWRREKLWEAPPQRCGPRAKKKHTSKSYHKPERSGAFIYSALDITTLLTKGRKKAGRCPHTAEPTGKWAPHPTRACLGTRGQGHSSLFQKASDGFTFRKAELEEANPLPSCPS